MATRILSRAKHTVPVFTRSFTANSIKSPATRLYSPSLIRPIAAAAAGLRCLCPLSATVRDFSTHHTTSSLNDPSPNYTNRPPKETILLDGCDFEHWLVVVEKPNEDWTRDQIIDHYIKTLATVVGSEQDARMKIYSVSTRHYFAFGALVSEELSYKLKEIEHVRWVLPDSYLDVKNKDYGGEPFINGEALPYDPKYHEEWVRNNNRANERNRRNDRPRNMDRSRNFERRRENMQQNRMGNQGPGGPGGNMGGPQGNMGPPPPNMGGPQGNMGPPPGNMGGQGHPGNMGGHPGNMGPPPNMGGAPGNMRPPPNMGGAPGNMGPPPNMGGAPGNMGQPPNMRGPAGNMGGVPQYNNMGGAQYNNMGAPPPNYMNGPAQPPNNMQNMRGAPPVNGQNFQQPNMGNGGGMPYNSNPPNMAGGNPYNAQDMPGRDVY